MSENKNTLLNFMDKVAFLQAEGKTEELEKVIKDASNEYVTLSEVGVGLIALIQDQLNAVEEIVDGMIGASQELQEERIRAIINALPEDTKNAIKSKFEEHEDDLLNEDTKGEDENDKH
ncbi:hypothetical protein FDJ58_gp183 [Bacillus phage SIOphi]|uniref:Uncharacterized protein n=1 Tax=Bacillus phage SIOphi TaxID=1285382 RepID=R4JGR9_9CAUD|nr:hypothetical protein FDJ58_gp183 [Bacillus phage SIOphi]AGK86991.1 hypothetical protein SIOphi_00915 [Bacillus phage SIOphi]